ncbi:MAG: class I SAM-dependent methyltransferase [Bacteroidota bacterium]|nr:class I SAM-dependent methyltransferase [Bacteroidota bacterium]
MTWFINWFNSPYYHILYKNRNVKEAELFIKNLVKYLKIDSEAKIIDIGCGKGRHSIFFNELGFDVTGIDLSKENILSAKKREQENLKFYIHDMREIFKKNKFNICVNLFTSFGYFNSTIEHQKSIHAMTETLKHDGILIIDFLNATKIKDNMISEEKKNIDNIIFKIRRNIIGNRIEKSIQIIDEQTVLNFKESVEALTLKDFLFFFKNENLEIIDIFGSYQLEQFNEIDSERLIIIARK